MAIAFIPEDRKQRYLLYTLGAALLGGVAIVGYQFLWNPALPFFQQQPLPPKRVEIDFGVFQTPAFLELGDPRPPISFPDGVGKDNPFVPAQ